MAQTEVGPNDIVIHLVNPYRCGDCGSEFCLRSLFLDHLAEHIDTLKAATPCHQIVCASSLVEQQPGGITVTRDILQINEQQMFELQDVSLDYTQLTPLKALEQAGILNLPHPISVPTASNKKIPIILDVREARNESRKISLLKNQNTQAQSSGLHIQILNTNPNLINSDNSNIQQIEAIDQCSSELDSIVHKDFFRDDKFKRDCNIVVSSPVQTDGQPMTEIACSDNLTTDLNCVDNKSILGRGRVTQTMKEKGNNSSVTCLVGSNVFTSIDVFEDHNLVQADAKQYSCKTCSKVFGNASVLERHQVVHTGAKPYSCSICFKVFNDISSHRKHSLIHKRQHKCPVCHRAFSRRTQLLMHMKQHKRKRYIQFGSSFHEVLVNVIRNSDGQLIQEYTLALLAASQDNTADICIEGADMGNTADVGNTSDAQALVKDECIELLLETKVGMTQTQDCISDIPPAHDVNNTIIPNVLQNDKHIDRELPKKTIYRCGHCKVLIFTRPKLSRHLIKHTNTRPFECDICLKTFYDKADLLHHHKTHTKPVKCPTCFSPFSKVLYLQNHLLKGCPVTDNDNRFTLLPDLQCQCNICQKILKNKANVLRHLRVHAFLERRKVLIQIGAASTEAENKHLIEPENLSQNVEDHCQPLSNSVGYHCLICGQEFRFKSFIITHIRMHLNQRPYKCTQCPKSFYARQMLKKHEQNHTRPYKCPACSKSFIRRYLMKEHFKKRHEQEDPLKDMTELEQERLIQCDICGKTMKSFQKSIMLSHIRLHKDVRPYECQVCCKSFISDNALRKHSLNHTKPYKCLSCSKGFSRRYLLTDHFKKKCGQKKRNNSELTSVPVVQEQGINEIYFEKEEQLKSMTEFPAIVDRLFEAKIITDHDPVAGSTIYTCQPCDKRFSIYDTLLRHLNTFSKPTACKYCRRVFVDKHLTLLHQRSCLGPASQALHRGSKKSSKVLGEQQQKVQQIMLNINKKMETLTSEPFNSGITNMTTQSGSVNSDEILVQNAPGCEPANQDNEVSTPLTRTRNALKEACKLTCPECGKGFETSRGLKIHVSSHVRLFKCEVCDKDFTQISNLRAHTKVHKNEINSGSQSEIEGTSSMCPQKSNEQPFCVRSNKVVEEECGDKNTGQKHSRLLKVSMSKKRNRRKDATDSGDDEITELKLKHGDLLDVTHRLMQSGTRGRPHSCKMCRRRFTEEDGLKAHMFGNHGVRS